METAKDRTSEKVLLALIKEPFSKHTATSLAKAMDLSRQGLWKILNKLANERLVILESIGNTKKSVINIKINWNNILTQKTISLLLTKEALNYERWRFNFSELEKCTYFIVLFGSIINSPKEANDIDLLVIVENKRNFKQIDNFISNIQKTQSKKIHLIDLTIGEFREELNKQNNAYIDALRKGIVLFGQDSFTKFIEEI